MNPTIKLNLNTLLAISAVGGRFDFGFWKKLEGATLITETELERRIEKVISAPSNISGVELIVAGPVGHSGRVAPYNLPGMGFRWVQIDEEKFPKSIMDNARAFEEAERERIKAFEQSERERIKSFEESERKRIKAFEEAERKRRRYEPLTRALEKFSVATEKAEASATALCPSLDPRDVELCIAWHGLNYQERNVDFDVALLLSLVGDYEAGRLLSARAAERAVATYYTNLGHDVTDISIKQRENSDNRWKDYDLLVDGRPIDIKNARRSFSSSDSYVEHCIPRFKEARETGKEVTVVGVLSKYMKGEDFDYQNENILILGEVRVSEVRKLCQWMHRRFGSLLNLDALWNPSYQPGWVFEYPNEHYSDRLSAVANISNVLAQLRDASFPLAEIPDSFLVLCTDRDLVSSFALPKEKQSILADLRSLNDEIGFSRPTLFIYVMGVLLESIRNGVDAEQVGPLLKSMLFGASNSTSPLWLLDVQRYVAGLIDMLLCVHKEATRQQIKFVGFKMPHPSILIGQREDGSWVRLVAYCGGWLTVPFTVKCGASPLLFGQQMVCPTCSHLICDACGYCSTNCDLVQNRQEKVANEQRNGGF